MAKNRAPQVQDSATPSDSSVQTVSTGRKSKPKYDVPEGGLTAVPTDYDPKTHSRLKRSDFANVETFKAFQSAINPLAQYPIPENGLTEIPEDWNRKKHMALTEANFADDKKFLIYDWQAGELECKAGRLRKKARAQESVAKIGDSKKANQLIKMMEKMAELKKLLGAEAVASVEAALSDSNSDD